MFGAEGLAGALGGGTGGELCKGGDIAGDEVATLRPGERLGQGGAELDQRVPGERARRGPSSAFAGCWLFVGGDGAAGEGGFDVVDGECLELDGAEFVGEDADGPVVAGDAGGGEVPVWEGLGPPEFEEFCDGSVAGDDGESVVGGAAELVEFVAGFGLGTG